MSSAASSQGNRLASVPEWQAAATAAYYWPINFGEGMEAFVAGSVQHVGSRFTQPGDQVPGAGNFASRPMSVRSARDRR